MNAPRDATERMDVPVRTTEAGKTSTLKNPLKEASSRSFAGERHESRLVGIDWLSRDDMSEKTLNSFFSSAEFFQRDEDTFARLGFEFSD